MMLRSASACLLRALSTTTTTTTTARPSMPAVHRPLLVRQHAVRETIPAALIPTFAKGTWRKPALSLRRQAEIRKRALIDGRLVAGAFTSLASHA